MCNGREVHALRILGVTQIGVKHSGRYGRRKRGLSKPYPNSKKISVYLIIMLI